MTTQNQKISPASTRAVLLGLTLPFAAASLSACAVESEGDDITEATQLRSAPIEECITIDGDDIETATISHKKKHHKHGKHHKLSVGNKDESLLRFDLGDVPAEAAIDSATLKLYGKSHGNSKAVHLHRVTADWDGDVITHHSFAQHFAAEIVGVFTGGHHRSLRSANITGLVTQWVTGELPNYGVLLEAKGKDKHHFRGKHGAGMRPALEVCYTLPVEDYCDPDPCLNSGVCANGEDDYTCACPAGFDGVNCENEIDECAANPCVHGECDDLVDAYVCTCNPGYEGDNCEIDINECDADPCQNDGSCTNLVNAYSCDCDAGFGGTNCEIDIDECAGDPCQNGACTDGSNDYTCACDAGWNGDNCELDIDDCANNPCLNGDCIDQVDAYECACEPGYTGTNCDIDIDECSGDPCLNGGTCDDLANAYECACAPGWGGDNCEVDIDDCAVNSCVNGVCVDGLDAFSCTCEDGWTGDDCDEPEVVDSDCPCSDMPYWIESRQEEATSCVDYGGGSLQANRYSPYGDYNLAGLYTNDSVCGWEIFPHYDEGVMAITPTQADACRVVLVEWAGECPVTDGW